MGVHSKGANCETKETRIPRNGMFESRTAGSENNISADLWGGFPRVDGLKDMRLGIFVGSGCWDCVSNRMNIVGDRRGLEIGYAVWGMP